VTSLTNIFKQSVVVFSKNYLPIERINLKRAIILLVTDKAEPVDFLAGDILEVRSPSLILQVPPCIRLKIGGSERGWKVPPVSRKEILRRDKHQCQYCGSKKNLTIDHVIPRSKGGKHTWDNVVIACEYCNSHKGDRFLHQVGMHLKTTPKAPCHPAVTFAEKFWHDQQQKQVNPL